MNWRNPHAVENKIKPGSYSPLLRQINKEGASPCFGFAPFWRSKDHRDQNVAVMVSVVVPVGTLIEAKFSWLLIRAGNEEVAEASAGA